MPKEGSFAATSAGTKSLVATYNGDANFNSSASSPATSHVVNKADTTTAVGSSLNPSNVGDAVTFTATISVTAPGSATPSGTVNFKDGATTISGCGSKAVSSGQATCVTSVLTAGMHTITAVYSGDGNLTTSTGTLSGGQVVNAVAKVNTTTTLARTAGTNPSVWGQGVTFTATVAGGATPTGTVQFKLDGVNLGSPVSLSGGQAQLTTSALGIKASPGHTIGAVYSGDAGHNGSTSGTIRQIVAKARTTTSLTSDANPAHKGKPIHFTATVLVTLPGAGTPTGKVVFKINGVIVGRAIVQPDGTAVFTITKPKGTYRVTATYKGDAHFVKSTSPIYSQKVIA